MNKFIFGFLAILLFLLPGCLDLFFDDGHLSSDSVEFHSITIDSTNYINHFEIESTVQIERDLENYMISSNQEFAIMNYGIKGIIRYEIEGGEETKISGDRWVRSCEPDISADDQSVTFASEGDIYLVNADGTELINITNTPDDYDSYPSFNEDGLSVVYSSNLNYLENDSLYAVCIVTIDDFEISEIFTMENVGYKLIYPLWSEQYSSYLFHYISNNSSSDSLSGVWKFLQGVPVHIYNSVPNETKLMISSDGGKLLTYSFGAGQVINISGILLFDTRDISYGIYDVFLAENGSYLMYNKSDNIYIYDFMSQESRNIVNRVYNQAILAGDRVYFFNYNTYG